MALPLIVKMFETKTSRACKMCGEAKFSSRYKYRPTQMIPDYIGTALIICRKCVYREVYGSKKANKAMKQKLLDKINHTYNSVPTVAK